MLWTDERITHEINALSSDPSTTELEILKEVCESALFKGFRMEGYILKPVVELYKSNNEGIITKIKFKDKFGEAFNF